MTRICVGRIELSYNNLDIVCHSGAENTAPDTISQSFCAAVPAGVNIGEFHKSLC